MPTRKQRIQEEKEMFQSEKSILAFGLAHNMDFQAAQIQLAKLTNEEQQRWRHSAEHINSMLILHRATR